MGQIRSEFPQFELRPKAGHRLSQGIDIALKLLTFGGQSTYLTEYHTVLGTTLFLPSAWADTSDVDRAILLRHERIHLLQRRRFTPLGMALLYLLPIVPVGLAYGRARLEWEAYTETLIATAELKSLSAARCPELRRRIVGRFTGPAYGWMWPFRKTVERWYDQVIQELERRDSISMELLESES